MFVKKPSVVSFIVAGGVEFPFEFKWFLESNIKVYHVPDGEIPDDDVHRLEASEYTIVSNPSKIGGTVTITKPINNGDRITIQRELPFTRPVDYATRGSFNAVTVNNDQDYQTYLMLDLLDLSKFYWRVPLSSGGDNVLNFPAPLANAYIRWDADGNGLVNDTTIQESVDIVVEEAANAATSAGEAAVSADIVNTHNLLRDVPSFTVLQTVDTSLFTSVYLKELHPGIPESGGNFVYDATADKSTADAGTIIDPSVSLANQGTGIGLGCWVRQYDGIAKKEWFDIFANFITFTNNNFDISDSFTNKITNIPMLGNKFQFGGTLAHYLSDNAVIINGDSVTQGANAGYYMDNGYAYKVKRVLMKAYKSTSFGYLSVDDKDGYITAPDGAHRYYEPSTNGILRQNENAVNAIGGTEVELGVGQFVKFQFNRQDKYAKEFIPNQRNYRLVFNDSTGSVRVTANGIGYTLNEVVSTDGTNVSSVLNLPNSWDGTITITQESGTPILNGIVLFSSEDDYVVHLIYNGGRALTEVSDDALSKIVTNADLYIHALGINDGWGTVTQADYYTKITTLTNIINASQITRCVLMDFMWNRAATHFTRLGLKNLYSDINNEALLIDIPHMLANGGDELSTAVLAGDEYKFLSSDEVHPFINGHSYIATSILSSLGLFKDIDSYPVNSEYRDVLLGNATLKGYCFGDIDLSKLIIGWTSDGNNSITYTEQQGNKVTGHIYASYIETKIPIVESQYYRVEIDIENIDSTGVHSFGTRSLDALGNEIWEQDATGGFSGNSAIVNKSIAIGTREVVAFIVGGRNNIVGTDETKFEPNAAFWNLGLTLNNGDILGNVIIHNISINPIDIRTTTKEQTTLQSGWVASPVTVTIDLDKERGVVSWDGWVSNAAATSGASMFILDTEHRPPVQLEFYQVDLNGNPIKIRIETGGYVRVYSIGSVAGWNTQVQLSGITYKV